MSTKNSKDKEVVSAEGNSLFADIRGLIASARERVAVAVNAELSMLY